MSPNELIKKYSNDVCEQIRWKKAKPSIALEIENHIYDQRDAYMADGENEENATKKAVAQMGDPVSVGREFDNVLKPKPQWTILIITGILMTIGMFISYYVNTSLDFAEGFKIVPYIMAFGILIGCYFIDFTFLGRSPIQIYIITVVLSFIGLLLGIEVNGRAYLSFGYSFPLSYLALIFPFVFSLFVYAMRNKGLKGIILSGFSCIPMIIILMMVPSVIGIVLFMAVALIILYFFTAKGWFGVDKKQGFIVITVSVFAVITLILFKMPEYVLDRLIYAFIPSDDIHGRGYIYHVISEYLSESSFFGKGNIPQGMGEISRYLPCINSDYSLIYIIHEFGFIVLVIAVVMLSLFLFTVFYKTYRQKNVLGSLIAVSVTGTFLFQILFSFLGTFGHAVGSSIGLPFISCGNTLIVINAALTGFLLSVFRTGYIYKESVSNDTVKRKNPIFSYSNGKFTINMGGK